MAMIDSISVVYHSLMQSKQAACDYCMAQLSQTRLGTLGYICKVHMPMASLKVR